ncbi:MAG TPA: sodium/proton-translocating pyrophosphatase, partial [Flavihumibacter sp.]|nr:sodium/proton-translocating pyrophosphatase [Flavihumibacter sp.]
LGGFLAGATVSGVLMGMFQNNAGGAWDNAKKSFEKGVTINGEVYYKKSEPHKASVTGDTVGDPFKDTSGPSMNILIKLMSIVSLVIAPTLADIHHTKAQTSQVEKDIRIENVQLSSPAEADTERLIAVLKADGYEQAGKLDVQYAKGVLTVNGKDLGAEEVKKYEKFLPVGSDRILRISTNVEKN